MSRATTTASRGLSDRRRVAGWLGEVLFILAVFFIYAGTPPPGTNEAHYFAKARHYWDPQWCPADVFLNSADAHRLFYWMFGWLTTLLPFSAAAWISRLAIWSLLAVGWQRLSWAVVPWRWASIWSAGLLLLVMDPLHLAGEWMVGGAEAKGIAYGCVLLGLSALVAGRWSTVWLWFGVASAFHVLVGGWSVVALVYCYCLAGADRPPWRSQVLPALAGLVLALPGLVPVLSMSVGVDPQTLAEANRIYVFERLPHHLTVRGMAPERIVRFLILLGLWAGLWPAARASRRWVRLNRFTAGAILIAATGLLVDVGLASYPVSAAALLRFYWFRLADVAVPVAVALVVPIVVLRARSLLAAEAAGVRWSARCAVGVAVALPALFLASQFAQHRQDARPAAEIQSRPAGRAGARFVYRRWRAWQDVCRWIQDHTAADARFLTPRDQQTFKWYAGRSEVVSWKDLPQDPRSIVQWWQTLQQVHPSEWAWSGLGARTDAQLVQLAHRYRAGYILVDRTRTQRRLGLRRVYPAGWNWAPFYELYEVPPPSPGP